MALLPGWRYEYSLGDLVGLYALEYLRLLDESPIYRPHFQGAFVLSGESSEASSSVTC